MWKHTRANHPSGGPDSYPASSNALTGQLRCRVAGEPRAAPLPGGDAATHGVVASGSSPWQAAARPTPRRPRFTWRRASSGWPGWSACCARHSSTPRKRQQQGRRPKACTPRSAGRGRAPLRWASPPRRGQPRPSASPQTRHGLIVRSRSSLGHSRLKAAVTSPRSHLRGQDLRSHACGSGPVSRPRAVTTRLTERRPHGARGRGSGVSGHGGSPPGS